jgi:hypothetical protein
MGINDNDSIFLTQEEHDLFLLSESEVDEEESEQQSFENAIMEVHRQYNLRSKKSNDNPTKKASDFKKTSDTLAKKVPEKKNSEVPIKRTSDSIPKTTQTDVPSTSQPKDTTQKNVVEKLDPPNQNKTPTSFSLESELAKLKIPIPLSELMNKNAYSSQVIKALNIEPGVGTNTVNIADNQPELLFGHEVEGKAESGSVPPFYISLNIHDKTLHNAMLDSGASHNLMPKAVMEKLGLDITRPYKHLYSFDSSKVKCIGLIKDLCITLAQIPAKSMVMDIVVANIPPKYGMLLSRSRGAKLQGTLQLDMSYATIPLFDQKRRLYRETLMKYMVGSQEKPHNYPLYSVHSDLDSFILYNDGNMERQIANLEDDVYNLGENKATPEEDKTVIIQSDETTKPLWSLVLSVRKDMELECGSQIQKQDIQKAIPTN